MKTQKESLAVGALWRLFLFLILILFLSLFLSLFLYSGEAHAEVIPYVNLNPDMASTYNVSVVEIDGELYLEIENYDLQKISSIFYRTKGFTLSLGALNQRRLRNGENTPYIALPIYTELSETSLVRLSNNKIYERNVWRYPLTDIINLIRLKGYEEWALEMEQYYYHDGADTVYMRFDAIMTTVVRDEEGNEKESGKVGIENGDLFIWGGIVYTNRPVDKDNALITALKNAYGWRDRSKIDYHFNRWVSEAGEKDPAATPAVEAPVSLYEIKNEADDYDISEAIPSGEEVTNTISSATFTGDDLSVGKQEAAKNYGATFYVTMHYVVPRWVGESSRSLGVFDSDPGYTDSGDTSYDVTEHTLEISGGVKITTYEVTETTAAHWEYDDYYEEESFAMGLTARLSYEYLSKAPALYQFESMTVYNNHFPENADGKRVLTYTKDDVSMPRLSAQFHVYSKQAQVADSPYLSMNSHMVSSDPAAFDYTPLGEGYHYGFAAQENYTYTLSIEGKEAGDWSGLRAVIETAAADAASQISSGCYSRNDYALINDGKTAFTLMSDTVVPGADVEGSITLSVGGKNLGTVTVDTNTVTAAESSFRYGGEGYTVEKINTSLLAARAVGEQTVTIPGDADNVDFPTGCSVTFNNLLLPADNTDTITLYAGKNFFSGANVDNIYDHVMKDGKGPHHDGGDPADGYPIRVHTPVITPVMVVDKDGNNAYESTQLVQEKYNSTADNQLLLDSSYYIRWDNDVWASALWGETPQGYTDILDKYVDSKWMRFPFDVVYNDTIYERDDLTGYTEWIEVEAPVYYDDSWEDGADRDSYESSNHWQMTPFYIPSFAQEGGTPGNDAYIQVKVYARNVQGRDLGSHESSVEVFQNSSRLNYVATAQRTLQLSGWLYDFTLVGTNNQSIYNGAGILENDDTTRLGIVAWCKEKAERKANAYNRLGNPVYRFLTDGSLSSSITLTECLPVRNGTSYSFQKMGDAWIGQEFAFTVKTIANLDGEYDSLEITPSFTYITEDGEILSSSNGDIKIYTPDAWDGSSAGKTLEGITYNPDNHSMDYAHEVHLGEQIFDESYYDLDDSNSYQYGNWVEESVKNENENYNTSGYPVDTGQYMARRTPSYTISHISIPASLRYLSGEYEQLAMNEYNEYVRGGSSTLVDYTSLNGYTSETETKVKRSMQQWQSKYMIPDGTKILDVRNNGGESFSLADRINDTPLWFWDKDPLVFPEKGRIIINFDIVAYKDGEPYLRYSGGNSVGTDMWEREHFISNDPTNPTSPDNPELPVKEGDVVVVDYDRNMSDYWFAAIHNIN